MVSKHATLGLSGDGPEPLARDTEYLDPRTLVRDVSGLVSPPEVCTRLFELMRSPRASARDFGEIIALDPNLTARLLRIVNSAFYGFTARVDTVSRAVTLIGIRDLYNLVIAVSAVQSFSKIASSLLDMGTFWRHSVFCGLASRELAKRCHVLHPERLFVAGLLHDVGSLVIFHRLPELSAANLEACAGDEERLHEAEQRTLGFDHAEVGALLLSLWQLPAPLHAAVRGHHRAAPPPAGELEAPIVRVANLIASCNEEGTLFRDAAGTTPASADDYRALGLDPEALDVAQLSAELAEATHETVELLAAR